MKTTAPTASGPVRRVNPLVLSLDDPADVSRSAEAMGPIFWTSLRPPGQSAGHLVEDVAEFEGAWLESDYVIVQIEGRRIAHAVEAGACSTPLLADILRRHIAGDPPNRIQSGLHSVAGI